MKVITIMTCVNLVLAVVGYGFVAKQVYHTPKVVTFDSKKLKRELVKSNLDSSEREFEELSKMYLEEMAIVVESLSKKKGYIVVPKEAVIVGSNDITDEVKRMIEKRKA